MVVIALIQEGRIEENKIHISDDLIAIFKKYIAFTPGWNLTIYNPFYQLKNEGFWHLRRWKGTNPPTSVHQLQRVGAYAVLDDALFYLLSIPEYREIIRQTLIDRYFPELRQKIEYLTIEQEAEEYSEQLIRGTQHPFSMHRDVESIQVEPPIRSAGFRRMIRGVYAYTYSSEDAADRGEICNFFGFCDILLITWRIGVSPRHTLVSSPIQPRETG